MHRWPPYGRVVPARLLLTMDDLAQVVAHSLGDRTSGVLCRREGDALLVDLLGIRLSAWLPRIDVPVRVTWVLDALMRRVRVEGRVRLSGLASLLLVPGQHFGGGRVAIDALVAAVGLIGAVVARDNTGVDLDLARAPGGNTWQLSDLAIVDGAEPGLVASFHLT